LGTDTEYRNTFCVVRDWKGHRRYASTPQDEKAEVMFTFEDIAMMTMVSLAVSFFIILAISTFMFTD
jgi:hypothetical protein